jgi:hypothetical protein
MHPCFCSRFLINGASEYPTRLDVQAYDIKDAFINANARPPASNQLDSGFNP